MVTASTVLCAMRLSAAGSDSSSVKYTGRTCASEPKCSINCSSDTVFNLLTTSCKLLPSTSSGDGSSSDGVRWPDCGKSSGRPPNTTRVEKCSISRSRSIAGLVTTATLSLIKSAIFCRASAIAANGASCPRERIGSAPLTDICSANCMCSRSQPYAAYC
ncbi:hypothetical protein D1872_129100 [compost metagenome]